MAIKRHLQSQLENRRHLGGLEDLLFCETYALTVLRRQVAKPCKMPNTHFPIIIRLVASRRAVAESSVSSLGDLGLRDGDNVDGDRVELHSS